MNHTPGQLGWLIVGHGTRCEAGQREFQQLTELITADGRVPTAACFLEIAEPTIEQGVAQLAAAGVREIIIVPLLLFSAGHAKQDVPLAVQEAATKHDVKILAQAGALECSPSLLQLSQERISTALTGNDSHNTQILLVARGSSDPTAIKQVHEYGERLQAALHLPTSVAFVAMTSPNLPDGLRKLVENGAGAVVVVPHLLFQGDVLETIQKHYAIMCAQAPHIEWRLASHLGPHPLVAAALRERIHEQELKI
jgi:sirohydrochlorin ferrochelatase